MTFYPSDIARKNTQRPRYWRPPLSREERKRRAIAYRAKKMAEAGRRLRTALIGFDAAQGRLSKALKVYPDINGLTRSDLQNLTEIMTRWKRGQDGLYEACRVRLLYAWQHLPPEELPAAPPPEPTPGPVEQALAAAEEPQLTLDQMRAMVAEQAHAEQAHAEQAHAEQAHAEQAHAEQEIA